MFKSWLDKRDPVFSETGSKTRPLYKPELLPDGTIDLVEDGYEDIYNDIQSFKDSVDINVIVARYAHGDAYALQQREGMYGDFISVPRSYMDVLNGAIELKRMYSENKELQEKFETLEDFIAGNAMKVDNNTNIPKIVNSSSEKGSDVSES